MLERIEVRLSESNARRHLSAGVGDRVGDSVRRVKVLRDDPLFAKLEAVEREFRERGEPLFYSWSITREYSASELSKAELLRIWPSKAFEPTGEECGTTYDESGSCDHIFSQAERIEIGGAEVFTPLSRCGVGARQTSSLVLRKIPKRSDWSRTIADELVASARMRKVFGAARLKGVEFAPVLRPGGRLWPEHFQFQVTGPRLEFHSSTKAGVGPFGDSRASRCPRGHIIGLNLLSEVTVLSRNISDADVMATRQMLGDRRGVLRPYPVFVVSPRAWSAIEKAALRGFAVEVAHLETSS